MPATLTTAPEILVVGGAGVDTIVQVPTLPLPMADCYLVPPIRRFVGHTGTGVALGCHQLGLTTRFVDVIGDDDEGRLVIDRLAREGLSFGYQVHPSGTRRAVNLVDPQGRRLSLYDARHPGDLAPDPDLWRAPLAGAQHVHRSIMPWAIQALEDAAEARVTTSTDLHDWDGQSDYHRAFAYAADIVFLSGTRIGDAAGSGPDASGTGPAIEDAVVADILDRGRAHTVVVMYGANGSRVTGRDGDRFSVAAVEIPGRPVVDSNGAGDSYVAAFLFAWLNGSDVRAAALGGALGGAWACGTAGTHTSFIDAGELATQLTRMESSAALAQG